ncbi:MAG: FecR domain-containing protein, partial [Pedobacter sp.]|nr:FecR domain-containing protein [Pedobacter sp.]
GKSSPAEIAFLETYFEHFDQRPDILSSLTEADRALLEQETKARIDQKIFQAEKRKFHRLYPVVKIAAALAVIFSVSIYFYLHRKMEIPVTTSISYGSNINPGGNRAFLTLADGRKINLDDARIGKLAQQGSAMVSKADDGQLIYDLAANPSATTISYNAIETPRGGTYQVVLPDGTKVWLNAGSKLTFPTVFAGMQRKVQLVGEAYFEVAKDKQRPFLVASGNQTVQVLGTHFNVSAYPDENNIRTTLLEGSVKVSNVGTNQSELLVPGQQARVKDNGPILVSAVNTGNAVAWKNGLFSFSDDNIEDVMKKVSRWYDIEVVYKGNITKEGFVGSVSRYEKIAEVLSTLELTGLVHFKVEGRRVTVMP